MSSPFYEVFCLQHSDSEAPISLISEILSGKDKKKFKTISNQFDKLKMTKVKDLARATPSKVSLIELPNDTPSLNRAMEIYSEHLDKLLKSAESEHQKGNTIVKQNIYIELLIHKPSDLNVLLLNAKSFFNCGYYDECIYCLERANLIYPKCCAVLGTLSSVYMKKSESDLAKQYLVEVYETKSFCVNVWANYADFLFETNDLISAELVYKRVLYLEPELYKVRLNYGKLLLKLNKIKEVEEQFEIAQNHAKDCPETLNYLANFFYKNSQFQKAISMLTKLLKIKPNMINACLNLGLAHLKATEYQYAANTFLKALELEPENVMILKNLAIVYFHQNKNVLSTETYKKCLKIQPRDFDLNLELAMIYYQNIKDYHNAACYLKKCTRLRPERIDLYNILYYAYMQNNDCQNASDTWMAMGDYYMADDDPDNARDAFTRAVKMNNRNAFGHWKLGMAYYEMEVEFLAISRLNCAIKLKPNLVNAMLQLTGSEQWIIDRYQVCSSWWCPKHGNLQQYMPYINPKTSGEQKTLRLANSHQKHWITRNKVKCCVFDRKSGTDKYKVPPDCYTRYIKNLVKTQSWGEPSVDMVDGTGPKLEDWSNIKKYLVYCVKQC